MSLGSSCGMLTHGWSLVIEQNMCVHACDVVPDLRTLYRFVPFIQPLAKCFHWSVFATLNNCCLSKNCVRAASETCASSTGWPIITCKKCGNKLTLQRGRRVDISQRQGRHLGCDSAVAVNWNQNTVTCLTPPSVTGKRRHMKVRAWKGEVTANRTVYHVHILWLRCLPAPPAQRPPSTSCSCQTYLKPSLSVRLCVSYSAPSVGQHSRYFTKHPVGTRNRQIVHGWSNKDVASLGRWNFPSYECFQRT